MYNKKAFTLVELLVVISIIAVLLAVLMPALSKARTMARRVICSSHMHNMGVTIENYKSDSDGYYPIAFWGTDNFNRRIYTESLVKAGTIKGRETQSGNEEWVLNEGATREAYSCPSFRGFLKTKSRFLYGWNPQVMERYPVGYGYNTHLSRYDSWNDSTKAPTLKDPQNYIGKVPNSSTLMLLDSSSFNLNNRVDSRFYPVYEMADRFVNYNGYIAGTHRGGVANSLFIDMHVKAKRADEYIARDQSDPALLVGACVLDNKPYKFKDMGITRSTGKIASE